MLGSKQPLVAFFAPKSHLIDDFAPMQSLCLLIRCVFADVTHGSNFEPNRTRSWILCMYSMYLMPRNPKAHTIVMTMQRIRPFRWLSCAHRTAQAADRLEMIRTQVLIAPHFTSR